MERLKEGLDDLCRSMPIYPSTVNDNPSSPFHDARLVRDASFLNYIPIRVTEVPIPLIDGSRLSANGKRRLQY